MQLLNNLDSDRTESESVCEVYGVSIIRVKMLVSSVSLQEEENIVYKHS